MLVSKRVEGTLISLRERGRKGGGATGLTILDNLSNEDGNLHEGEEVYNKGYLVLLAAHHA